MCETCDGSGRFAGRVEHYRWEHTSTHESATYSVKHGEWWEGDSIPCPSCQPSYYGTVTKVTKHKE